MSMRMIQLNVTHKEYDVFLLNIYVSAPRKDIGIYSLISRVNFRYVL